ncbi:MAG: NADH-quinone oxidoreductase subunit N [Puniceicoccaceae bacterium]
MDIQVYQEIAATNTWGLIIPEILLVVLGLVILMAELTSLGRNMNILFRTALVGLTGILTYVMLTDSSAVTGQGSFGGLLEVSAAYEIKRVFFLISAIFVCVLARRFLSEAEVPKGEFLSIVCFITAAMMVLCGARHFLLLFVALETVTIGFYVLVAYSRNQVLSLEAGLKYLIMGALSTAILLMGAALLYGVSGLPGLEGRTSEGMDFDALSLFISLNPDHPMVLIGAALVLCGICFKIGAVPFQIWVPDVYQGSPLPTTAFLAVASKAAGFFVLINLITGPFRGLADLLIPLLSAIAVATILFGNLSALTQRSVKRVIGLSGIAHAGYLLLGATAAFTVAWAESAVMLYLFIYLFASFGLFGVINSVDTPAEEQSIDGYSDLSERSPFFGFVLVVSIGSLAGIPPLAGFIGKFFLFTAAFEAGLYLPLAAALVGVVLSIYYYFGWIREAVFRVWHSPGERPLKELGSGLTNRISYRVALGVVAFGTIIFGIYQKPLTQLVGL